MTASGTLDGGAVGTTERAFPALDGVRMIAATFVVLTHTAFWTGDHTGDAVGRVLSHLDVGVAIFFVLSGFLLFRPFAMAFVGGEPAPSASAYLWRRALRILPAYWVTVVAALLLLPGNDDADRNAWVRNLALVHVYDDGGNAVGLEHTWSLCVEVVFYLLLPLLAAGLLWLSRKAPSRPAPTLIGLAVLALAGAAYLYAVWLGDIVYVPTNTWFPAFAGWFAGGMALALLGVSARDWRPVQVVGRLGTNLGACWAGAAILFGIACSLGSPYGSGGSTPTEAVTRNLLYGGAAVLFVLPFVVDASDEGPVRRALSSRPARYLGEVSYGLFLVHLIVLVGLYDTLDAEIFTGNLWLVAPVVWVSSVALASLLYVAVERPARRWRTLVPDRVGTGAPRADVTGKHHTPWGQGAAEGPTAGTARNATPRPVDESRLMHLARSGRTSELVAALDAGAPVDLADEHGDTLLITAADHAHAETVAELLSRGAAHSPVNDRGQTALSAAVFRRSADAVRHLLAAGADPDAGTPSARATATHFDLSTMTELLESARR